MVFKVSVYKLVKLFEIKLVETSEAQTITLFTAVIVTIV
jgi:hypothetical protein